MGSRLVRHLLLAYGAKDRVSAMEEQPGPQPEETIFLIQPSESLRQLRAEVKAHGSPSAFADLLAGTTDIGLASRRPDAAEVRALAAARVGEMLRPGNENVVALDGIVLIVHRDNPVRALTPAQVTDLLSGAVTNWSAMGGPDRPVAVYADDSRSGTFDTIRRRLFTRAAALAATAEHFEAHEDVADAVAGDPGGIGFVALAYTRNARPVALARACGLPPVEPTAFQVKTEEYPLSRRLYFYVGDRRSPVAEDFLRYALSPAAEAAIGRAGFAGLGPMVETGESVVPAQPATAQPATASPAAQAQAASLRSALAGAHRLSVTIRFESGQAMVDSRGAADLERLKLWVRQAGAGTSLTLVGHSSADGDFGANVVLSRQRAQEVANRLRGLGVPVASVLGVGPAVPVACDGPAEDANLNRRVEVWVR